MAYTTLAKIKSMFRKIAIEADTGTEANNTAITEEEVTEFMTDADALIDAILAQYYVTPITGTESLKLLDVVSKYLVADTIKGILELTTQSSDKTQDVQGSLGLQAHAMLKKMVPHYDCKCDKWIDAVMPLPDAVMKEINPTSSNIGASYGGTKEFSKGGGNW